MNKRHRKSGSSPRKLRRANEVLQRKAQLPKNGSSGFATVEQVNAVVQQLNDNQQALGRLINSTNTGMANAFTIQDAHLHVMQRVFNDMSKDFLLDEGAGTLKVNPDCSINWRWYYNEYDLTKVAVAFVMWVKKMVDEQEQVPAVEVEDDDFVFGGDYADSHNASSQASG